MTRRLLWKLCLIIVTGIVALFYIINYTSLRIEADMSLISSADQTELKHWGAQAEEYYAANDIGGLQQWLEKIQNLENISAAVVSHDFNPIAGNREFESRYLGYNLGRNIEWQVHLYFEKNPLMELPFSDGKASFIVVLPDRMRPGTSWPIVRVALHVVIPMSLLIVLMFFLYQHIMVPLQKLQRTTVDFSRGNLNARVAESLGNRNDELSELAGTFDQMASRISDQLISQRQLIADLSHELRTPLTRLDIAISLAQSDGVDSPNLDRIGRESVHIRKLVEDTLTLACLENEQPQLEQEDVDLVDLIDVIVDDAKFEFPDKKIVTHSPSNAELKNTNHRSLGQALENIIRNALRFTPKGGSVDVHLQSSAEDEYIVTIEDNGPGVDNDLLDLIFQPFYRVDQSRNGDSDSFGLGLALAKRQLRAVRGSLSASNRSEGGLRMCIRVPKS